MISVLQTFSNYAPSIYLYLITQGLLSAALCNNTVHADIWDRVDHLGWEHKNDREEREDCNLRLNLRLSLGPKANSGVLGTQVARELPARNLTSFLPGTLRRPSMFAVLVLSHNPHGKLQGMAVSVPDWSGAGGLQC